MRGINKVTLVGTLGSDPIVRTASNGAQFANFAVATSEAWQDKQTGEWREHTEWHRIVARAKMAEYVAKNLKKGNKVYLEGSLNTRSWTDEQKIERYVTEIRLMTFQRLDTTAMTTPV